jgi:hypothetical protein
VSVRPVVLARLRSAVNPTYDGEVPLDSQGRPLVQRYAVLYASPGTRSAEDLCRVTADRYVFRWQVTSVGETPEQAEWVAIRGRDALLAEPLMGDGWQFGALVHRSSSDIRPDRDIPGGVLFYAVDIYELPATR